MIVCATGHRPNKLGWGYDYSNPSWIKVKGIVKQYFIDWGVEEVWSGMALGFDIVVALAVLELKKEGYDIKLNCAIPCRNHSCKWPQESVDLYDSILEQADSVVLVTDAEYKPYMMQKRNEFMVDQSNKVLALWDGSKGGTGNCVEYALSKSKPVTVVTPFDI